MTSIEELKAHIEELNREKDAYAKALADSNSAFREKVSEFSIIKRIGDSIRWNLDKRRLCIEIVDIIIDETTAENCSLWLVEPDKKGIQLTAVRGQREMEARYFPTGDPKASRMAMGEGVAGWVAQNGSSKLIENADKSGLFVELGRSDAPSQIKSLLCLPIKGQKEVSGVVNMSHPDIGAFSIDNERALNLIATQAGLAFENLAYVERIRGFNEELERTVAERTQSLRYSESKYRSFMENAGDAILIADRATRRVLEANELAVEYSGFSKDELVGKDLGLLFGSAALDHYGKAVNSGSGRFEWKRTGGTDAGRHYEIAVSVIPSPTGEVAHLIIRDITDRLMMEAQLKEYNEHLEEIVTRRTIELEKAHDDLLQAGKMAAIGELASGVAHEINNPVAIISGYSEDLIDKIKAGGLAATGEELILSALSLITAQAERCMVITNSLLNFARKQEIFISPVNVNHLAVVAQGLALHKLGDKKIVMENRFDPELPLINSDLNLLEQILLNIYNNAVDAIEKEGVVRTETVLDNGRARITISDTGFGIPPELMSKIFDPFFTTKPAGKGTGLGLSLCRQMLERLKGKIRVESAVGKGAAFTVTLPVDLSIR